MNIFDVWLHSISEVCTCNVSCAITRPWFILCWSLHEVETFKLVQISATHFDELRHIRHVYCPIAVFSISVPIWKPLHGFVSQVFEMLARFSYLLEILKDLLDSNVFETFLAEFIRHFEQAGSWYRKVRLDVFLSIVWVGVWSWHVEIETSSRDHLHVVSSHEAHSLEYSVSASILICLLLSKYIINDFSILHHLNRADQGVCT